MDKNIRALKALADETRLKILNLLRQQRLCGKALAARLDLSEAAVSQHIRLLKEALLIEADKMGYWTHYGLNGERLRELARDLASFGVPAKAEINCRRLKAKAQGYEGKEIRSMCKPCCERPDRLKGKPADCTPAQIRECHGDVKDHPCERKGEKGKEG